MADFNLPAALPGRTYEFVEGFVGRTGDLVRVFATGGDGILVSGFEGALLRSTNVPVNLGGSSYFSLVCIQPGTWKVQKMQGAWELMLNENTAGPVFSGEKITVRQLFDQPLTDSTVLIDSEMRIQSGVAGGMKKEFYKWSLHVLFDLADVASGYQFRIQAAAVLRFSAQVFQGAAPVLVDSQAALGSTTFGGPLAVAGVHVLIAQGIASGAMEFQFAQDVSDPAAISILAGSTLTIHQL